MRTSAFTCLLGAMLAVGGCQPKYTQPIVADEQPTTPRQRHFQDLWDASRDVLISYHFRLDRQDPRAGVITTYPMTGKQIFELWRKDAARLSDSGESTIQTIYRAVRVTLQPVSPDAPQFKPVVEVFVRRSDKPTGNVTSTSDAYALFARRERRKVEPTGPQESEYLVDLGNDRSLEAKLTAEIIRQAAKLQAQGR